MHRAGAQHGREMAAGKGSKTNTVRYFAYGSNMSSARLRRRVPDLSPGVVARLPSYRRTFDKSGTYGGKTNMRKTEDAHDLVPGVVFNVTPAQLAVIAEYEVGYESESIKVTLTDGEEVDAVTFVATETKDGLRPTQRYLRHLLVGAREHVLTAAEIQAIEITETEG